MKSLFSLLIIFIIVINSFAQSLSPGDPAPAIMVGEWVKGKSVTAFKTNNMYVVEFWATWCAPCKVSIPHLTELAKKYASIPFIGVSVSETNTDNVKPFVDKMGNKMNYNIAIDKQESTTARKGFMLENWLNASGTLGIPAAFVVGKKGTIEFIGAPEQLDSVLQQLQAGTWDLQAHTRQRGQQKQKDSIAQSQYAQQQQAAVGEWNNHPAKKLMDSAQMFMISGDHQAALVILDRVASMQQPGEQMNLKNMALNGKMNIYLATSDKTNFYALMEQSLQELSTQPTGWETINQMLWMAMIDPNDSPQKLPANMRDYTVAVRWMEKVVKADKEKSPALLDSLAWAYFQIGNKKAAIDTIKKALLLLPLDDNSRPEFEKSLAEFSK